jgi:hypothetical protein
MIQAILRSWFLIAHTAGVLAAGIAAAFEIRSILYSGPILTLTGLLIAVASYRAHRRFGLVLGLAAPTATIAWFLIIVGLSWNPDKAHLPVSLSLVIFALAHLPLGIFSIEEMCNSTRRVSTRFQFGISTLFSITLVLALYLGILRAFDPIFRMTGL